MSEYLPPNTGLLWMPNDSGKPRIEAIEQHDGVIFFNHDISGLSQQEQLRIPTPTQTAVLACVITGMTREQTNKYLGLSRSAARTHLSAAYSRLYVTATTVDRKFAATKAMVRLCQRKILELGRAATVHHEASLPSINLMYELMEDRINPAHINPTSHPPSYPLQRAFTDDREQAGFETDTAYALHLVASQQIKIMPFAPERMQGFPALVAMQLPES